MVSASQTDIESSASWKVGLVHRQMIENIKQKRGYEIVTKNLDGGIGVEVCMLLCESKGAGSFPVCHPNFG